MIVVKHTKYTLEDLSEHQFRLLRNALMDSLDTLQEESPYFDAGDSSLGWEAIHEDLETLEHMCNRINNL